MINETALMIACIVLSLVGLLLTLMFFVRRRPGRAFQAMALLFAPVGLYLTGAARLLADGLVALWRWARGLTPDLVVWIGVALVALAIICWIVGSPWAAHSRTRRAIDKATGQSPVAGSSTPSGERTGATPATKAPATGRRPAPNRAEPAADEDLDDIEAILKKRGIE